MSVKTGSLAAVLLVASTLTGCQKKNPNDAWNANAPMRYCVDASGHRVADERCEANVDGHIVPGGSNGFLWYYLSSMNGRGSNDVPNIGWAAHGGSYTPAAGVFYSSVSRGGFGGTAGEI